MDRLYDTHVHVWTLNPQTYPWHPILAQAGIPTYPFTGEDLIREMDSAGVGRALLVQPSTYGWDNSYMLDVLSRYPERFRGVALADPADPSPAKRYLELASAPGVKGLRFHLLEAGQERMFRETADQVRAAAQDARLVVTFQVSPGHLAPVAAMARAASQLPIVVDHLGLIRWTGPHSVGLAELLELAELPNVYVKLSGLEELSGESYPFRAGCPLAQAVAKRFGPARLTWGSNFPHARTAGSYRDLAGVVDACLPALSDSERDLVRWQNAAQLWGG
jgi:L-fucono-1,5-lactonase